VAGQVDRDERPAERERDRVPRVCVLRTTVEEHELGRPVAPHERAQHVAGTDLDASALHNGWPVVGEADLLGILAEHSELVVLDGLDGLVAVTHDWSLTARHVLLVTHSTSP